MININRNNYEEYFIDFLDGKLDSSEIDEVLLFLDLNPDLKEELELLKEEIVVENEMGFSKKQDLKRTNILFGFTETNFDELCIAHLEKDLTATEEVEFNELIQQGVEKQKQLDLYKLTKMVKDESIIFPNKKSLKKKKIVLSSYYYILSAAASVVFLIALYVFVPKSQEQVINDQFTSEQNNKLENNHVKPEVNKTADSIIEKVRTINNRQIEIKADLPNRQLKVQEENIKVASINNYIKDPIGKLEPLIINLEKEGTAVKLAQISLTQIKELPESNDSEAMSFRSFLASSFNKRVLNKEEKDKIELFDIAQAGVNGINKLTGSNMSLERKYDENGIPDKTEFTSKLIAFSAPIKKE